MPNEAPLEERATKQFLIGADGGGAVAILQVATGNPANDPNALSPEMLLLVGNFVELVESLDGMNREDVLAVRETKRLVFNHPGQVFQSLEVGTRLSAAWEVDGFEVLLEELAHGGRGEFLGLRFVR